MRLNGEILELGERGRFCTTTLGTVHPRDGQVHVRLYPTRTPYPPDPG